MAATNQDLKDFFALTGNNPAITNEQLTRLQDAMAAGFIDPPTIDADWLVDRIYEYLVGVVLEQEKADAATAARAEVTF